MNPAVAETPVQKVQNKFIKKKLYLSYRDPFLKKEKSKIQTTENNIKNSLIKPMPVWPQVKYYGYFKDRHTGIKSIDIKVNQKTYLARANQIIQGVRIRRITKDSIRVEYSGVVKTFYNKP